MNVANIPLAEHVSTSLQAKLRVEDNGADGAISLLVTETEPKEKDAPIREMIPTTVMIFSIPTNATLDGNVLTKLLESVVHQLKEKVLEATRPANNTANQFHLVQININATSQPIPVKNATQSMLSIAARIVRKPVSTAKLQLANFSNATDLSQKLQTAKCATPVTKDVPHIPKLARTAHHSQNSRNAI